METKKNLEFATKREALGYFRYLAFAKKAEEESHSKIARMMRDIAEHEKSHALSALRLTNMIGNTHDNLETLIAEELLDSENYYPNFARKAKEEKQDEEYAFFKGTEAVEKEHYVRLKHAEKELK